MLAVVVVVLVVVAVAAYAAGWSWGRVAGYRAAVAYRRAAAAVEATTYPVNDTPQTPSGSADSAA